jgi:hypothetical protein
MQTYKVLEDKEYNKLKKNNKQPIIGCLMMVKNEEKRIQVSLSSVVGTVDCMIIYDTGSTDKTIDIIKNHCDKHKINLYMIQGEFIDFSTSRNISLDYADTKNIDFILLLDTNDELRNGEKLKIFAKQQLLTETTGYLMCQQWWSGKYDKYFNTRFIKANTGWRYKGVVHEYMTNISDVKQKPLLRIQDDILIYQDRTKDDDKSSKRFAKDKEILLKEHKLNRTDTRTLFYLSQTCACLNQPEESFYFYKLRCGLEGFQEEKFHSFLKCGELSEKLQHNWHDSLGYYMKALEHSNRVEPLIRIAQHYNKTKQWILSYTFIKLACSFRYPVSSILFVDNKAYDYTRWHIMGIVSYYCGNYNDGKNACLKALEFDPTSKLDRSNLGFYVKKEESTNDSSMNKREFISKTMSKLKAENSKISMKQMKKISLNKWKNRK